MAPKVILICDDALLGSSASAVSDVLASKFGVGDVACRPLSVPPDRFLSSVRDLAGAAVVYAILTAGDPSASTTTSAEVLAALLDRESPSPVVRASMHASDGDGSRGAAAVDCALSVARACAPSSADVRSRVATHLGKLRQSRLVEDAQIRTKSAPYARAIEAAYDATAGITGDGVDMESASWPEGVSAPERVRGKVRDRYDVGDKLALVTTDRQSGFDRMLALVPYKGAVLNLVSKYWFEKTEHIVPNHLIAVPHPNVSIVRKCTPFPIEFVVRSYMTGSTSTSIWKNYQDGVRNYCGHALPESMKKNQKLSKVMLTPTTKEEEHDRPISAADIIKEGWMNAEDFAVAARAALDVFAYGQKLAAERGLILVDTKYEFGKDADGTIRLIDEVNTPDSSRYWLASSYEDRIAAGLEPENIDKEFLRLWFRSNCDPYKDETLPEAPRELVCELSRKYVSLYEMITWKDFEFDDNAEGKIAQAICSCTSS